MPPASSAYSPIPPPQSVSGYSPPPPPPPPQQAAKRPKLQQAVYTQPYSQQQSEPQTPSPPYYSPQQHQYPHQQQQQQQQYHYPQQGSPPMSAQTSMLPPPPPSQQAGGGASGGGPGMTPKATDTNELADALASAGIDLREEEAHLAAPSHPVVGVNAAEAQNIRRAAEMKANHAMNPFLNIRVLQTRIRTKAREHNMTLGIGPQAQGAVGNVPQDITTFLSLAMRERIAGLLTRSVVLARQRRVGNGMISGEWGALVKGGDKHLTTINSDGGAAASPLMQNPLKRSFSAFSNPSGTRSTTVTTTSIANETARALRQIAQAELHSETLRLHQKSLKASSSTNPTDQSGTPSQTVDSAQTPGTPSADSTAPDSTPAPKKLSAKESRKNQDTRIQEAVAHRAANSTAAMMMGLGGPFGSKKKKKVYAWMTAGTTGGAGLGGAASGTGGAGTPSSPGPLARTNSAGDLGTPIGGGEVVSVWGRRIGEWREDGEKGLGIQIRDWAGALEGDGREGKAVVKAYLKMK